jgi:hypothetical protein
VLPKASAALGIYKEEVGAPGSAPVQSMLRNNSLLFLEGFRGGRGREREMTFLSLIKASVID